LTTSATHSVIFIKYKNIIDYFYVFVKFNNS